MENDSIRASGTSTLVDIWVDGKLRAICVEKEAIASVVGFDAAARMSEDDRCEFVRTHLPLVVTAVKSRLGKIDGDPDSVALEAGQLGDSGSSKGDRRKTDRRTTDRRKADRPKDKLPHGERRRGDRRKRERRRPPSP
jgi:hypothetical protein